MADLSPDQEILNQIAAILGSIAPPGASEIVFHGKIYEDANQGRPGWIDGEGTLHRFSRKSAPPLEKISEVLELVEGLKNTPAFAKSPFSQFEIRLTRTPSIEINTADIPREDSWSGLYMRPLSALTWAEAEALRIPREAWEQRQSS